MKELATLLIVSGTGFWLVAALVVVCDALDCELHEVIGAIFLVSFALSLPAGIILYFWPL